MPVIHRQDLRKTLLKKRKSLTLQQQKAASLKVANFLRRSPLFLHSKTIAFYLPTRSEVDPLPLMQKAMRMKKKCYLPVLHPLQHNQLWFVRYKLGDVLVPNQFGILQPIFKKKKCIPPWALNLVLVPTVGFDKKKNRLGMGKGYYDRTFAFVKSSKAQTQLVGLAYECQKVATIKTQSWDVPLNRVVTESRVY